MAVAGRRLVLNEIREANRRVSGLYRYCYACSAMISGDDVLGVSEPKKCDHAKTGQRFPVKIDVEKFLLGGRY